MRDLYNGTLLDGHECTLVSFFIALCHLMISVLMFLMLSWASILYCLLKSYILGSIFDKDDFSSQVAPFFPNN